MVKAVTPIPFVRARFFDRCGKPLAGGKVYTYDANTTTDKITYKDSYGLSPNTNPVILDAAGEADIYLDGTYRIRITDRNDVLVNDVSKIGAWFSGNLQDTLDNISGAMDDAIKPTLKNLEDTIATAAAAGAGANGWTDLLVQTQNGRTQAEKNADSVSVKDFGAKGDGVTDDTQAFANAALANVAVNVPKGVYVINQNIVGNFWTNDGVETKGDGCIYIKDNRKQQMLSKVVEKMYNGQPVNITCFGDSTTEGVGSSQHTKFRLESGQERTWTCSSAYPAQLQKLLQDIFNNSNIKVNNAGYAGKTLYNGWAANNIKSKVTDAFATEILIIGFGLNDVANSDFTADKYLIELKKIVGYAISRNIVPIILTPNYNANEPWRSNYKLCATVINSIIEYCKADNILCIDVHKDLQKAFSSSTKVTTTLGYIAPDTLHYNNYGYGLVASSIAANLVANVFIVDGYTKITPEMGNIYRASEATTQYYNPNLAGVGGNYVWGSTDLQVNDELYEVWFYNTIPNAVLRYHAISNDGCVNTDRLSILVLNAAADDTAIYKHIASGTPYDHGVATAVENSQILQTLDVGLYKVGLKLNTALPNSTTDGFVLSGYFSVSAQPQLSYANSAVLPKKTAPYCKSLVLDVNNDVRFGFGDNTTLLVTGLMPKDSGFIICQSPAMYSNTEIQNGRDAIHDNTQEGILIFRDVWGNTKLYRVVFINKIEQIWLYELTSISNSYTDDNIVMLVNLKKDTTNFTLSASYQKGGTGNLSYTAKHKDWNMPVGGITGSVFRGTSVNSELLVSLNYELL